MNNTSLAVAKHSLTTCNAVLHHLQHHTTCEIKTAARGPQNSSLYQVYESGWYWILVILIRISSPCF